MNPFLNPVTGIPFLKNFLFDAQRLRTSSPEKINKYRDKVFRRIVRYADTVPLFHIKYQAAHIHPNDINGINDIAKLPFISKQDIVEHFPNDILPRGYKKKNTRIVSTAGSTGKQISIFTDFSIFSGGIGASLRIYDQLNLNWRTSRLANIGNFNPNMADSTAENLFYSKASFIYHKGTHLSLNAF